MRSFCRKKGFSLVEILTVLTIIAVLAALTLGLGRHIKEQGNIRLTKSTIDIVATAVEMYHQDKGEMPFLTRRETSPGSGIYNPVLITDPFLNTDFAMLFGPSANIVINTGTHAYDDDWSSEALYYFLDKNVNSRSIISAINDSQVTSRDSSGAVLNVDISAGGTSIEANLDMPRFVDAWDNALRYRYTSGASFCVIVSLGKDKKYGTADDITNIE